MLEYNYRVFELVVYVAILVAAIVVVAWRRWHGR